MKAPLQLSVLDQSPVREGGTATDALHETIALAVATEALVPTARSPALTAMQMEG